MNSSTSADTDLDDLDVLPTPIGIVISKADGSSPNILRFSFMITSARTGLGPNVRHGQYCAVDSIQGQIVGIINQIHIFNNYFHDFQTVKNFNLAKLNLRHYFPSDDWEIQIAEVQVLGSVLTKHPFFEGSDAKLFGKIEKVGFPAKPGNEVYLLENDRLRNFLGLDSQGLFIGHLSNHDIPVSLNLNRLFNKHVAILAQSGAGKSYLISVILEELLNRPTNVGTPAMILFDLHGEYRFMKDKIQHIPDSNLEDQDSNPQNQNFRIHNHDEIAQDRNPIKAENIQSKIQIINASFMQIGVQDLAPYEFQKFQPKISHPQLRELRKAYYSLKKSDPNFTISTIIQHLIEDETINTKVRDTLIGWLEDLQRLNIFAPVTTPSIESIANTGKLTIIDLSTIISSRKKQILVHFFTSQLFYKRRMNKISPFIIFLEEAHNFLPESAGKEVIAKRIFETIAREGRKFFGQLVLISQRPVRLSTTALSQCNSHIIMRITNPYDLNHIKASSESLTGESVKIISSLPTGNALILGAALNYPVFVKVRKRAIYQHREEYTLESVSKAFWKENKPTLTDPSDITNENENNSIMLNEIDLLIDERISEGEIEYK
ncbi:MAG: ATP-binding protein [Promethearchaeota archaeon]